MNKLFKLLVRNNVIMTIKPHVYRPDIAIIRMEHIHNREKYTQEFEWYCSIDNVPIEDVCIGYLSAFLGEIGIQMAEE